MSSQTSAATPPLQKPQPPEIEKLFSQLKNAGSAENAKPIEAKILETFAQSGSPSVDVLMSRVNAAQHAGSQQIAGALAKAVTQIAPAYSDGWRTRGELLQDVKDDEGAIICLQKAITINPRHFQAYFELAQILADYGDKPAALQYYRKAQALDPYIEGLDQQVQQLSRQVEGEKI